MPTLNFRLTFFLRDATTCDHSTNTCCSKSKGKLFLLVIIFVKFGCLANLDRKRVINYLLITRVSGGLNRSELNSGKS